MPVFQDFPDYGFRMQASAFCGSGTCERLDLSDVAARLEDKNCTVWYNLVVNDKERTMQTLVDLFGMDHITAREAVYETERPALEELTSRLFMTVKHIVPIEKGETYSEIAILLGPSFMVTIADEEIAALKKWFVKWHDEPEDFGGHPALLLHSLLDEIIDDFFPASDAMEEEIDDIEEQLYTGTPVQIGDLMGIKRRLNTMRRRMAPTRDILNALLRRDIKLIPDKFKPEYQDLYDRSMRVIERIDLNRDILSDIFDAHLTVVSNNLNQIMKVLTVVSTIFMSMGFIAGVYGMNFGDMPELKWKYGYPYAIGLMLVVAGAEYWLFKRKKWL